jgi:DNA-binding transcriptional LysR family regulator
MNLNQLRHVVMVYRMGSFTAAAAELNVSQSSVTKSVAWVEQDLGYALFDRRARGVSVTEAGRDFIDRALRIVSDMDRLAADTATGRAERSAILRIGVAPPSVEGLLNRAIRALLREPDQFRLHVQAGSTQKAIALLGQGDIDILVGPTEELSREPSFALEPLPDFVGRIFCRRGHPLADRTGPSTGSICAAIRSSSRTFRRRSSSSWSAPSTASTAARYTCTSSTTSPWWRASSRTPMPSASPRRATPAPAPSCAPSSSFPTRPITR